MKITEFYKNLHTSILQNLKNEYDNIFYFDFSSVNYPDSLYGDVDHLNAPGMERYSSEIKDLFAE